MKDVDENGQEKGTIRSATAIYTSDGKTKLKEIEAREYKSTVITSGEISNAMNITDGKAHSNKQTSHLAFSFQHRPKPEHIHVN